MFSNARSTMHCTFYLHCLCVSLAHCLCLCICLSVSLSLLVSVSLSLSLSLNLSQSLFSLSLSLSLSLRLSVCLPVSQSRYLSVSNILVLSCTVVIPCLLHFSRINLYIIQSTLNFQPHVPTGFQLYPT